MRRIFMGFVILLFAAACGGESDSSATRTDSGMQDQSDTTATSEAPDQAAEQTVGVVAFVDPLEPNSRSFLTEVRPRLKERYEDAVDIDVRLVPVPSNPPSVLTAKALICAEREDRRDDVMKGIFGLESAPTNEALLGVASEAGLDAESFETCLDQEETVQAVNNSLEQAKTYGIRGIPTIMVNDRPYEGLITIEVAARAIDDALGRESASEAIPVTIVHDADCEFCDPDSFIQNFKRNLYPNLEVRKLTRDSMEGGSLLARLDLSSTPLYLFGSEIETISTFERIKDALQPAGDLGFYFDQARYRGVMSASSVPDFELAVTKGDSQAPVTLLEFADFHCSHCKKFAESVSPQLREDFVKSGKLRTKFMPFPLQEKSFHTAQAALCVARQSDEEFWEYHDRLFENQSSLDQQKVLDLAREMNIDQGAFDQCMDDQDLALKLRTAKQRARTEFQVSSTPTIFVDNLRLKGAPPYNFLTNVIESQLAKETSS